MPTAAVVCCVLGTLPPLVGDGVTRVGAKTGVTLTDVVTTGVFTVVVVGTLTVGGAGAGGWTGSFGTVTGGGGGGGGRSGTLGTEGTVVGSPIPGAAASAWLAMKPNRSMNPKAAAAFMTQ